MVNFQRKKGNKSKDVLTLISFEISPIVVVSFPRKSVVSFNYKSTSSRGNLFKRNPYSWSVFVFLNKMIKTLKKLGKVEWETNVQTNFLELCTGFISAGGYGLIILMLVNALLAGEITVGAFSAVFTSIGMLHSLMQEMINKQIGQMAADLGRANNFIHFMELPERNGDPKEPVYEKGIVIENVSFVYPHSENKSLDDVSLEIKAGETIAIVGETEQGKPL